MATGGFCSAGAACTFAHGPEELRPPFAQQQQPQQVRQCLAFGMSGHILLQAQLL